MAPVSVGLEIGAAAVKMVEVVHRRGGPRLTKLARVEIQPELEDEERKSAIVKIVKTLARNYGLDSRRVVSGVGGESVIVRRIEVPPMPEKELTQAIRWQAEEHLPYPLDEVYLDFHMLGWGRRRGEPASAILVGAKKATVDTHLEILNRASIVPQILDANPLALFNIFKFSHPQDLEDIALVEMGHTTTSILILEGGFPFLVRNLSCGGADITRAVGEKLGIDYSRANQLKEEYGLKAEERGGERVSSDLQDTISEGIKKCMDVLLAEIIHSLDYYSSHRGKKIRKIAISGGCAYLNNICKYLSSHLGLLVERNNPFAGIDYDSRRFSSDYLEKESSFFGVGSGLALREIARI